MTEWQETTILEIISLIGGGTPKTNVSEYWDGNIPWLCMIKLQKKALIIAAPNYWKKVIL